MRGSAVVFGRGNSGVGSHCMDTVTRGGAMCQNWRDGADCASCGYGGGVSRLCREGDALLFYLDRAINEHRRRNSKSVPPKTYGRFDEKQRWFPNDEEKRSCCSGLRSPSASSPWGLLKHCSTIEHIANRYDIDPVYLRREIKRREALRAFDRITGGERHKELLWFCNSLSWIRYRRIFFTKTGEYHA